MPATVELDLESADDADADEVGARQPRLLVEVVEDVVQVPAGQHLVRFEDRKVISHDAHGDPRNQKFQVRCVRSG